MQHNKLFISLCLIILPGLIQAQCAMCRAVLESGEGQEVAQGINNGIIYLMAVPYILIGVLGYYIFKKMK
ncbi:hypothetical protein OOZ15_17685 [Galbibacter sp. EGI 63066]|uniref:hypothetical protein n=1 Tax=Galbibacter sp. EGI 63066 TaxID=2993559 RepID=UPI002249921E|nr:hypothetical protein [Galbibacter sp. EGI 63066]MCX2681790.1 hypothetical protein [Galbibacter sp. EGI 63066]